MTGREPGPADPVCRIVSCSDEGERKTAVLDLSAAYPSLELWRRTLILEAGRLTVTDEIDGREEVEITWPIHTLSRPEADGNAVRVTRRGVSMRAEPAEGGLVLSEILDRFPVDLNAGQPTAYHVTMPQQFHVFWRTERKRHHRITVVMTVSADQ